MTVEAHSRTIDTANVADLLERYPELRRPLQPPPAAGVPAGSVAELAETYARQADDLAHLIEEVDRQHRAAVRVALNGLAELHVALDELAHRAATELAGAPVDGGVDGG